MRGPRVGVALRMVLNHVPRVRRRLPAQHLSTPTLRASRYGEAHTHAVHVRRIHLCTYVYRYMYVFSSWYVVVDLRLATGTYEFAKYQHLIQYVSMYLYTSYCLPYYRCM